MFLKSGKIYIILIKHQYSTRNISNKEYETLQLTQVVTYDNLAPKLRLKGINEAQITRVIISN